MKKLILNLALVVVFSSAAFAQTQEDVKLMRQNTSHWSLGVKGGLDYFRVSPHATGESTIKTHISQGGWSFGAFAEYAVNPYYGIGLEGGYYTYNRGVNGKAYKGNTIDLALMSSINMSNLLAPYRTGGWRNINFYLNAGLGGALYTSKTPADADYVDRKISPLGVAGVDLEFNLGKHVSLLLEGQYRYYVKNDLGGAVSVTDNDALAVNLGLRWKIGAGKKDHVRNMIPSEYYPVAAEEIITETIVQVTDDALNERVKTLENNYARLSKENQELKNKYNDLKSNVTEIKDDKVKALEDELKKLESQTAVTVAFENIEFDFNSYRLSNNAKNLLDQIVSILQTNNNWNKIIISGHTDNVGTVAANKEVSKKRANAVKDYMVSKGINENKLTAVGFGMEKPIATNTTVAGRAQNRRVEFEISK
ncbi:OmpA family protein [Bacteroidales bacterium OttesenSCG-928-K22]|nr:OmpA family protein [Bacteroidales bacterium OttesenSCG-928-L14]MDL2240590.1 OmpA family protein [Bacteroidales bacterium OttesenSCG-928-K22]